MTMCWKWARDGSIRNDDSVGKVASIHELGKVRCCLRLVPLYVVHIHSLFLLFVSWMAL